MFSAGQAASGRTAVIVSYARTPIGRINGSLAAKKGSELGAVAVRAAVERAGLLPSHVEEVILGNVVSAGMGQAPARQAAIFAGLPESVCCTTVNKVGVALLFPVVHILSLSANAAAPSLSEVTCVACGCDETLEDIN